MFESRIVLLLITSVLLTQWKDAKSLGGSETRAISYDADVADAILENIDLAEFKERYRRLIPYMNYFVAKNYVNSQVTRGAKTREDYGVRATLPIGASMKKLQGLRPTVKPDEPSRVIPHVREATSVIALPKRRAEFVPSVRYDPREPDDDADYFTPVRYETKVSYDGARLANRYAEHGILHRRPILRPEVASSGTRISQRDNQAYPNEEQLSRPDDYSRYEVKYSPEKSNARGANSHRDSPLDHGARAESEKGPTSDNDYGYSTENGEPAIIEQASRHQRPKPTRILAQIAPRGTPPQQLTLSSVCSNANNRPASLEDITRSLRLTDRLPEVLDRNNIDGSLETLVEILGILNGPRSSDFTRATIADYSSHRDGNAPRFDRFERVDARPSRVVTETIFQATPRPRLYPQSHRYETEAAHDTNNQRNNVLAPNREIVENEKNENFVERGTFLHETGEKNVDARYEPSPLQLGHRTVYEHVISEDLLDNVREERLEEKHVLPVTTRAPVGKFRLSDGGAMDKRPLGPPVILDYGATRGKPNVDYPVHAAIPETHFSCKKQRYKGFFGDPSTRCQVWHYCDLNGGKSSFLCPNGTIFSQVALTCDWWFNVKCESTTQLYVLNERLYKYILPIMPKFPEDFTGPEVDRYLELKFKEMEAKLKEKMVKRQREKERAKDKLQSLDDE